MKIAKLFEFQIFEEGWEEYAGELVERILDALDDYCRERYGDLPHERELCYSKFSNYGFDELVGLFGTIRDRELLVKMPYRVYKEYSYLLQEKIQSRLEGLRWRI